MKEIVLLNHRRRISFRNNVGKYTRKHVKKRARGKYEGVPVVYKQQ